MNPKEYPHPERLTISDRLVPGGPKNWEVLEVFSTPATRLDRLRFPPTEKIDVALLMPKKLEPGAGFEMTLSRINRNGLSTKASDCLTLEYRGRFILFGTGFSGIYFSNNDAEQRATQEMKDMGHAQKIDRLEGLLREYRPIITEQPGYLPAWQAAARNLAPAVAAFYLLTPERTK